MRAAHLVFPLLASSLVVAGGCVYEEMSAPPEFSEQVLQSLCDYGRPLVLRNRGYYQSRHGTGELLLVAHLANQPLETYLNYQSVRLEYQPANGLAITLTDNQGQEKTELMPKDWIQCADDAMELELPSNAFYVWASVGVKSRRLLLQVAPDGGLVMRHLWEEKGMIAIVFPLKITGDGWASFPPDDPADHAPLKPLPDIATIGGCPDLAGTYSLDGISVRLDGSLDKRTATDQFFRPEIIGDQASATDEPAPLALRVFHAADGGIQLSLMRPDGQNHNRYLGADTVTCEGGRWFAKGKKDMLPAFMLLFGSIGSSSEDLHLSRDREGALMVQGTYRSGGILYLIPTGTTASQLFMRFPLLAVE